MLLETVGSLMLSKGLETISTELVKTMVETHIKPILKKHAEWHDSSDELEESMQEYLKMTYKKALEMHTIVFRGVPKTLCDLYIPLTIVCDKEEYLEDEQSYLLDDDCIKKLDKFDKILIVDMAGMGKSTISKFLVVQYIIKNDKIPVLIELRKIGNNQTVLQYLIDEFKMLGRNVAETEIISMLRNGEFVIFFDGYDEVNTDIKGKILEDIQKFIQLADNNKFILTSRREEDLSALGYFRQFNIKPLSQEEAFSLIRKYDKNGSMAERLINRLQNEKDLFIVGEFLTNPLLVSLLYRTFLYKEEIACKKIEFYDQVYEALFNDHDKLKGGAYVHPKESKLDIHNFSRLLKRIGYFSVRRKNKVEFSREELFEIIEEAINNMPWLQIKPIAVFNDLLNAVPFFQRDGTKYKWVHKSFMEYFAAGFICFERKDTDSILKKMVHSDRINEYMNILDFCFDMRPEIVRQEIVYPLICQYIEWCEKKYTDEKYEEYDQSILEDLKSIMFTDAFTILIYDTDKEAEETFSNPKKVSSLLSSTCQWKKRVVGGFRGGNFLVVSGQTIEGVLCELLLQKNIDIFKQKRFRYNIDVKEISNKYKNKAGEYELSASAEQWYNQKEFIKFTHAICMDFARKDKMNRTNDYVLDYGKCRNLKKQIEEEKIKQEQIDNDLFCL